VAVPPQDVRPTSERARQAYFNIVAEQINGARFLDLFAGSGIFSFEAISRGAASATTVDRDRRSAANISRHAAAFGVPVLTVTGDVLHALRGLRDLFDLTVGEVVLPQRKTAFQREQRPSRPINGCGVRSYAGARCHSRGERSARDSADDRRGLQGDRHPPSY